MKFTKPLTKLLKKKRDELAIANSYDEPLSVDIPRWVPAAARHVVKRWLDVVVVNSPAKSERKKIERLIADPRMEQFWTELCAVKHSKRNEQIKIIAEAIFEALSGPPAWALKTKSERAKVREAIQCQLATTESLISKSEYSVILNAYVKSNLSILDDTGVPPLNELFNDFRLLMDIDYTERYPIPYEEWVTDKPKQKAAKRIYFIKRLTWGMYQAYGKPNSKWVCEIVNIAFNSDALDESKVRHHQRELDTKQIV